MGNLNIEFSRSASTQEQDEHFAVADIAEQLRRTDDHTVLFFCSSRYDLARLKEGINQRFSGNVIGCTSAGLIGPHGFQRGGLTAVSLSNAVFDMTTFLLQPLSQCQDQATQIGQSIKAHKPRLSQSGKSFGLLLVDGLSMMEEQLVAALHKSVTDLPIIGGSAGDDLRLRETHVWYQGAFHSDAAVLAVATTAVPFQLLRVHHFVPSDRVLTITAADPKKRTILEINGEPAALAYADLVEVSIADLNPNVFSRHPLLIELEGKYHVRSIQRVNGDGALIMSSAIETGQKPCVGEPRDPLAVLKEAFDSLIPEVREPTLVIGFDCVLRRLEFEQRRIDAEVGRFMARHNVIGFCSYGEQYDNLHVNQTFTGVALKLAF